jgi:hypothetical protein
MRSALEGSVPCSRDQVAKNFARVPEAEVDMITDCDAASTG